MKSLGHMSLLSILLLCGFEIQQSTAQTEKTTFRQFIEKKCYDLSDEHKEMIYGQQYPLAQTLENFLYLVEKYELANPDKSLKEVTAMLLRNYTIENLLKSQGDFVVKKPDGSISLSLESQWENMLPDESSNREENFPFDDDEVCSLYFMLSHTVNDTAWPNEKENTYFAPSNGNGDLLKAEEQEKKSNFPREQGVVRIETTNHSVALGRVIAGIYLGLSQEKLKKQLIELVNKPEKYNLPDELKSKEVNLFYVLTISDMLALATWEDKPMAGNGQWYSFNTTEDSSPNEDATGICPNVYKLREKFTSYYTYSLLRGAIDGVILGNLMQEDSDLESNVRLSQLLRMYYTKKGIPLANPTQKHPTFCQRGDFLNNYKEAIKREVESSVYILSDAYVEGNNKAQDRIDRALSNFNSHVTMDNVMNHDFSTVCSAAADPKTIPCETPSDVIAVLDTSSAVFLKKQQIILGYLANNMKLWHQGSKMTILLDKRNGTNGLGLEEFLPESSCSACVACHIIQHDIEEGNDKQEDIVIQSIDQFLQAKKDSELELNGAAGKVLIYFNYAETEESTPRLEKALVDLRLRHHDIAFFAVGQNEELLLKYTRNNALNAITGIEFLKTVAENLADRICSSPAALQYSKCAKSKDESSSYYQGLVTPNTIQHWSMNPKYFLKSYRTKISFAANDGNIKVCYNRASAPEISKDNCKETNSSNRLLEFPDRNPCKGFNEITCGEMRFAVIGIDKKNGNGEQRTLCRDTEDKKCKTIDQIGFKVTYEGIRCSGCSSLASTVSVVTIAFLFYFLFVKNTQH